MAVHPAPPGGGRRHRRHAHAEEYPGAAPAELGADEVPGVRRRMLGVGGTAAADAGGTEDETGMHGLRDQLHGSMTWDEARRA